MNGYATRRPGNRRGRAPKYDPLMTRAKLVADELWERAMRVAEIMAPEEPSDAEPLDDLTTFQILQTLATNMSPEFWDSGAVEDYHRLLGMFAPEVPREHLPEIARMRRQMERGLPDPSITPQNPEYKKMLGRMSKDGR